MHGVYSLNIHRACTSYCRSEVILATKNNEPHMQCILRSCFKVDSLASTEYSIVCIRVDSAGRKAQ